MQKQNDELKILVKIFGYIIVIFLFAVFLLTAMTTCLSEARGDDLLTEDEVVEKNFTAWHDKCKKCHGNGDRATSLGLSRGAPPSLFFSAGSKELKDIDIFIRNGHKNMDPFEEELSQEEIEILSKFIRLGHLLRKLEAQTDEMKPLFKDYKINGDRVLEL